MHGPPPSYEQHGSSASPSLDPLDFADLVGAIDAVTTELQDFASDDQLHPLHLLSPTHEDRHASGASFVVALFCDGFVCRHWTRKGGWVEGFAQSYDATSRYFLDCLEKERLPDGLLELIDPTTPSHELKAEIWDLRAHATALCPLTSADLPHTAPLPNEVSGVSVREVVLKQREHIVLTDAKGHDEHPASEQFPQLSNADLEALTYDELASLALGLDVDLVQVDESVALLSVDEVVGPADETHGLKDATELNEIDTLLETTDDTTASVLEMAVNDDDDHRDDVNAFDVRELITPKGTMPSWDRASGIALSPRAFLSPNESKVMPSQAQQRGACRSPPADPALSWPCEDTRSSDDDWVVKNTVFRSIAPIDSELAVVKSEQPSPLARRPTKQAKKKKHDQPTSPSIGPISLDALPASSLRLSLSQDACNWLDAAESASNSTPKKKKKKYRSLRKPSADGATPLPATHLFLSKLRGKRPRTYTIDELDHASPAWMMMKHMTRFYQEALTFERRHAHFLQVNVERIMTADGKPVEPTKIAAGSMNYIATQLHQWTRPDQVIAASSANGSSSPVASGPTHWRPSDALLHPDEEDEKLSSVRSPTAADSHTYADLTLGKRSPTSALAAIYVSSPTPKGTGRIRPPTSLSSVQSPLGTAVTPDASSFMDAVNGESFEF